MSFRQTVRTKSTAVRQSYGHATPVRWLSKALPIFIVFGLWELTSGTLVPSQVLPPFTAAAAEALRFGGSPELHSNLFATFLRGSVSIVVSTAIAVPLGIVMARNERVRRNLDPIISMTYPVPKSPLIPLLVFWLGMGHLSRILLAVIGSFLPILLSAYNGASGVEEKLLWAARSMGIERRAEPYRIVLPAALPTILTGVRIGLIFSFIIVISSEIIMANSGLGYMVMQYGEFGQYASVFGLIFWIGLLVAGLDRLYLLATTHLLRWSEQGVGSI